MPDQVRAAFEQRVMLIRLDEILPSRVVPQAVKESVKYRRISASIAEVGLIEPLMVTRQRNGYLLLDGHLRLNALRERGDGEARCILASDDEGFTYNKRVNRLSSIQEHFMIVRAIERGVSKEKLARALDLDVGAIQEREYMLVGISGDVVELLKDRPVGRVVFRHLRRMKPMRQLEVAELMVSANNFSTNYSKALLATSKPAELHKPDEAQRSTGLSPDQMARLEREMNAVTVDYKELEMSYGDDVLVLVVAAGFLERLLGKPEIERFLQGRYPEFLETFRTIAAATSLDQPTAAAA